MAFFTDDQIELMVRRTVRSAWLIEMQFKSATSRVWAGDTPIDINGHLWQPTYGMVQIEGLGFTGEPVSQQVTVTAPGVDETLLSMALAEGNEADQQPAMFYLQFFGDDWQPVGGLAPLFFGLMQQPRVSRSAPSDTEGAVQSISLPIENPFYNRARPPFGRFTALDQNRRTPVQDDFFNFVPSLANKTIRYPDF